MAEADDCGARRAALALAALTAALALYGRVSLLHSCVAVVTVQLYAAAWWCSFGAWCRSVLELPRLVAIIHFEIGRALIERVIFARKPHFSEWTPLFAVAQPLVWRVMHEYGANLALARNAQAVRALSVALGSLDGWFSCRAHQTRVEPVHLNGLEHLWVRGTHGDERGDAEKMTRYVVLYLHGGGYTILSPRFYVDAANRLRAAILAAVQKSNGVDSSVQVDVFLANYRKSPEYAYPAPQEDALLAYEWLVEHEGVSPSQIVVAGDSAGGGLVLSTLMRLRDKKARQPLVAIAACPLADLADDGRADPKRGQHCILTHAFVQASVNAMFPQACGKETGPSVWKDAAAAYCDLRGLSPVLVQVGTADYLHQDSLKLFAKAKRDGVTDWELEEFPNMPHIFFKLPPALLPSSTRAVANMGEFVAKHIARVRS